LKVCAINDLNTPKISPAFRKCLQQLRPGQRVRAIVLLGTEDARRHAVCAGETRERAQEGVRDAAAQALDNVDAVLSVHDSQRLTAPNVLGSVVVEGTAPALRALADLPTVKAVLEDQPLALLR
jgi:phytoene/squalene synthetase